MPKKSAVKTPALKTEQVSVVSTQPVVETVVAVTPVVEKKVRQPKVAAPVVPVPVSVPVVETTENVVVELSEQISTDHEVPVTEQSIEFLSKLQQLGLLISALKNEYRVLEKKWSREIKAAQKLSGKRKRGKGNRSPSGFVKPTKISDELANFLGKEMGTEMARTDVTREINTYIRANNLQDKTNGRKIIPDNKLALLLKLSETDELTYFNLQKYMSPHFAKAVKAETVVA